MTTRCAGGPADHSPSCSAKPVAERRRHLVVAAAGRQRRRPDERDGVLRAVERRRRGRRVRSILPRRVEPRARASRRRRRRPWAPPATRSPWKRCHRSLIQASGCRSVSSRTTRPSRAVVQGAARTARGRRRCRARGRTRRHRSAAPDRRRRATSRGPCRPRPPAARGGREGVEHVCCPSTPVIRAALPASGSEVAPPPTPTSRTVPPSAGPRRRARSSASGRRRSPRPPRVRNSSAGKPTATRAPPRGSRPASRARQVPAPAVEGAHPSSRRISSVCSPSGRRRGRGGLAVEPDRARDEPERAAEGSVDLAHERGTLRRGEDLVERRGSARRARRRPRAGAAIARPGASRRPRRARGSARRDWRRERRSSRIARRPRAPACRATSHVARNSLSLPAARMNGRSAAWNTWYGTMFGCSLPIGPGHDAADQVVRGLVHERGHARRRRARRPRGGRARCAPAPRSAARIPIAA